MRRPVFFSKDGTCLICKGVVPFWKKALPALKQNSAERIAASPQFQKFINKLEKVRARQSKSMVNTIDEPIEMSLQDLQMEEAVHIVKDMIQINGAVFAARGVVFAYRFRFLAIRFE